MELQGIKQQVQRFMEERCAQQRQWLGRQLGRAQVFDYRLEHTRTCVGLAWAMAPELGLSSELAAIAAWLHDLAKCADLSLTDQENRARFKDHGNAGAREARAYLNSLGLPGPEAEMIAEAIRLHVGFFRDTPLSQPLAALLWDADKLSKISLAGTMHFLLGQLAEGREITLTDYYANEMDMAWREGICNSMNTSLAKAWAKAELELVAMVRQETLRTLLGRPPI
jgi:putative nucleotidyltransferase with HDIG domain